MKQIIELYLRSDPAGHGEFGAPRGGRPHCGVDYVCTPGKAVASPVAGKVTKLGYPYGDDLTWRYVQITGGDGNAHRLFYVEPTVSLGDTVAVDQPVGVAQDITKRYPDQSMLPHVHYEIKTPDGEYQEPPPAPLPPAHHQEG